MNLKALIARCLGEGDAVALGSLQADRWEQWLHAITKDSPAGEDPSYDDDFQRMREEVNKLSGADVDQVAQLAEKLTNQRCKDLRVGTYYLWARLHKDGERGLADGLGLLAALVQRFAGDILPARPNSRKLALEWLTSSKVLDCLTQYPEVVKEESERTVAALAWLERGMEAWPQDQRADLSSLYSALSARMAQSGGVDALVPQNTNRREADASAATPAGLAIKSGRDLLDSGRILAGYLREQPLGRLAAQRLLRSLRWDTLHHTPPQDAGGVTRLAPPRGEYRAQLKRLHLQQDWSELLNEAERMYAEGVNHFWLDLQWYACQALSKLPAPHDEWAGIIRRDLGMFLERLPGLELLCWSDGTPFADETTREWIVQHVSGNRSQQWLPAATPVPTGTDNDIWSLEVEALAQADSGGVEQAIAWLAERPDIETARQRWLLRLLMARVAEQYGKSDLAVHLLGELDATAQRHGLDTWEPALHFEVKARLLKLLRLRAQRSGADKITLGTRMESLLAALVALDPVRAAVLCG